MIFTQVFITSFLTLQWISFYIYHVVIMYNLKSDKQRIIHYFIWYVSNTVYYLINVKSFYLSTLTSRLFRTTFFKALFRLIPGYQQQQQNMHVSSSYVNIHSKAKSDNRSQCEC
jgi:hypothetical protein